MWHWVKDGEQSGPHQIADVVRALQGGRITGDDLVWTDGMDAWAAARTISELSAPPPLPHPASAAPVGTEEGRAPPETDKVESSRNGTKREGSRAPTKQPVHRHNFIIRHWKGQLPLPVSYWVIGVLLSILMVGLAHAFGSVLSSAKLGAQSLGVAIFLFLLFLACLNIWQLVGIWRSAGNSMVDSKRRFWPIAARVMVVLGAVRVCTEFGTVLLPMMTESSKLAMGIEDTPPHRLQLLKDGTEVELSGGMPFGTAAAFKVVIDSAPMIETVHLNSSGGRISEAQEIAKIIKARKLQTFTRTHCESACTIAFLGGTNRFLATGGRLGFHSASYGNVDGEHVPSLNADFESALRDTGIAAWFVKKAMSTPASGMWYPTYNELREVGIVTRVVNADTFASVDVGQEKPMSEKELCSIITSNISKLRMPMEIAGFGQMISASVDCSRKMIVYNKQSSLNSWEINMSAVEPFKRIHRAAIREGICKDPIRNYGWGYDDTVYTKDNVQIFRMQVLCKTDRG